VDDSPSLINYFGRLPLADQHLPAVSDINQQAAYRFLPEIGLLQPLLFHWSARTNVHGHFLTLLQGEVAASARTKHFFTLCLYSDPNVSNRVREHSSTILLTSGALPIVELL
jgi:hypothetical protein